MNRLEQCFTALKKDGRKGLVTFLTAGDPDLQTSQTILNALPQNGADVIEIGMPFSDPMADGPAIQQANIRALDAGTTLENVLEMVKSFRVNDTKTPLVLMGYYNPIYNYGTERFIAKAAEYGVDGLIIVDLPPEEDSELREPASANGMNVIRLLTPTTDADRITTVLSGSGGFLYYVSIAGVTGTASADMDRLAPHLDMIRSQTDLPIAIGFGIKTPADVKKMAQYGDAVVVGSAIVNNIGKIADGEKTTDDVLEQVRELAAALKS